MRPFLTVLTDVQVGQARKTAKTLLLYHYILSTTTLDAYTSLIDDMRSKLTTYNTILSGVDNACTDVAGTEKVLRDLSEQMLMGVVRKFGKNSHECGWQVECEKLDRKRPKRSVSTAAVLPSMPAG
jgi:hypothetical protein